MFGETMETEYEEDIKMAKVEENDFLMKLFKFVVSLFGRDRYSDVTLLLEGGLTMRAHQLVLFARSDSWIINTTDKGLAIILSDIKYTTVMRMLKWVYTDHLDEENEIGWEALLDLIKAASKFKLLPLLSRCENALMSLVNKDNCRTIIKTVEGISVPNLIEKCSQALTEIKVMSVKYVKIISKKSRDDSVRIIITESGLEWKENKRTKPRENLTQVIKNTEQSQNHPLSNSVEVCSASDSFGDGNTPNISSPKKFQKSSQNDSESGFEGHLKVNGATAEINKHQEFYVPQDNADPSSENSRVIVIKGENIPALGCELKDTSTNVFKGTDTQRDNIFKSRDSQSPQKGSNESQDVSMKYNYSVTSTSDKIFDEQFMNLEENDSTSTVGRQETFDCQLKQSEHMKTHNKHQESDSLHSFVCGEEFNSNTELNEQTKTHEENATTVKKPTNTLICGICGRTFLSESEIKEHVMIHAQSNEHVCGVCGKQYRTARSLRVHATLHTGERPFVCDVCGKTFPNNKQLSNHMISHSDEKPFTCSHCGKKFKKKSQLSTHMRYHTGDMPYQCEICGQTFATSSHRKVHLLVHTGEKPFKCSLCDRSYRIQSHYADHMKKHTGAKDFKCDVCGLAFALRTALTRHALTHTSIRPHVCDKCGKSFVRRQHLIRHYRIHTGEKPYECEHCGQFFRDQSSMLSHTRTHTGEKPYHCDICNTGFSDRNTYKRHHKKHELS